MNAPLSRPPPPPLHLTHLECLWLLRRLRSVRVIIASEMLAMEERVRGRHNGDIVAAHRALDGDLLIADGIIRKLWRSCGLDQGK